jgi:opacity protein-like surface antigen
MTAQPKQPNSRTYTLATLLALTATLLPALAQTRWATEGTGRKGMTEVYGIVQYLHSENIDFNGPSGSIDTKMDDTGLGGFGFAFHFNDSLSIHGDFMFGPATFSSTVPLLGVGVGSNTAFIQQDGFLQTGRFNLDYNIINRRFTPFVTGGLGYQFTEIELENINNFTYWNPWYGWTSAQGHPYAWQADFTWNAGAGLRWNITDHLMVKATGGATWLEYDNSHGVTTQLEAIFAIGYSW